MRAQAWLTAAASNTARFGRLSGREALTRGGMSPSAKATPASAMAVIDLAIGLNYLEWA